MIKKIKFCVVLFICFSAALCFLGKASLAGTSPTLLATWPGSGSGTGGLALSHSSGLVGSGSGTWTVTTSSSGIPGFMSYGPYSTAFQNGVFKATFSLEINNNSPASVDQIIGYFDVHDQNSGQVLAKREFRRLEFNSPNVLQNFDLSFVTNTGNSNLEFRVFYYGYATLTLSSVSVYQVLSYTAVTGFFANSSTYMHVIGAADTTPGSDGWVATAVNGNGYMSYGPYSTQFNPGIYLAEFNLALETAPQSNSSTLAILDVHETASGPNPDRVLASIPITGAMFSSGVSRNPNTFIVPFEYEGVAPLEFRVYVYGLATLEHYTTNIYPNFSPTYLANSPNLSHQIGSAGSNNSWVSNVTEGVGYLTYGPYTNFVPPGVTTLTFSLAIDNNSADNGQVLLLDAHDATNNVILASRTITRKDFVAPNTAQNFDLTFELSAPTSMEYRVYTQGISAITHYSTTSYFDRLNLTSLFSGSSHFEFRTRDNFFAAPAGATSVLGGTILKAGQTLTIQGGTLAMQTDGNLVVYQGSTPIWATSYAPSLDATGFFGPTEAMSCSGCYATFQTDGNLVLYNPSFNGNQYHSYWASGTGGNPTNALTMYVTTSIPAITLMNGLGQTSWSSTPEANRATQVALDGKWYIFNRQTIWMPGACGQGMQVVSRSSSDQGSTWSNAVPIISPEGGNGLTVDGCIVTDGSAYFDAPTDTWHYLGQCLGLTNYTFTVPRTSSAIAANSVYRYTYTANGTTTLFNFAVSNNITSGVTTLMMGGSYSPPASGVLTLSSGSGPATISYSSYTSTYNSVSGTAQWGMCHYTKQGASPMGPFVSDPANPVVSSGQLWNPICANGKNCYSTQVPSPVVQTTGWGQEGTPQIIGKSNGLYYVTFHGAYVSPTLNVSGNQIVYGARGIAATPDFHTWYVTGNNLPGSAMLTSRDCQPWSANWNPVTGCIGTGDAKILRSDGYNYILPEAPDLSLGCTAPTSVKNQPTVYQNWDYGLLRSTTYNSSGSWQNFTGNPFVENLNLSTVGCGLQYQNIFRDRGEIYFGFGLFHPDYPFPNYTYQLVNGPVTPQAGDGPLTTGGMQVK